MKKDAAQIYKTKAFNPGADRIVDNLIKYAVAPRPICLASTQGANGRINLSPFSYFNLFSHNPPICVFAPVRRMRDSTTKHTLENIREVRQVVINIVNYAMVQQQSLASTEYEKEINEFAKSGFTPVASELIAPPRVAESPVQMECKVREIIDLGTGPGQGSLVVAEVVRMHVQESVMEGGDSLDQAKLDLVARLGGDWYCRANAENLFLVPKPLRERGVGVDRLPESIRLSTVLTGNQLGLLGNVAQIPDPTEAEMMRDDPEIRELNGKFIDNPTARHLHLHQLAARYLDKGDVQKAWLILSLA